VVNPGASSARSLQDDISYSIKAVERSSKGMTECRSRLKIRNVRDVEDLEIRADDRATGRRAALHRTHTKVRWKWRTEKNSATPG